MSRIYYTKVKRGKREIPFAVIIEEKEPKK